MRKPTVFIVCALAILIVLTACNPDVNTDNELKMYEVKGTVEASTISWDDYDGVKGTTGSVITVDEPIVLTKDFVFDSVTLDGGRTESDSKENPIGINLSSSRSDITITIKDSELKNFGYAITSNKAEGKGADGKVNSGSLTLIIENTDFSNCFKGLYATDIKNLTVKGGSFVDMGAESVSTTVVTRSGSALDINQMINGGTISITGATFEKCGKVGDTNVTSGAIKIKTRGGEEDKATDIPTIENGVSFEKLVVKDCIFGTGEDANRYDVVLGTSGYSTTKNIKTIDIQSDASQEDNSVANPDSGADK